VKRRAAEAATCWGVYRETEHSPHREADDAGILEATGRRLEAEGFTVAYRTPGSVNGGDGALPTLAFSMCEGIPALEILSRWERRGVCVVNGARAVKQTHRERTIPLLEGRRIPMPESLVVDCAGALPAGAEADRLFSACWVKQATGHKTREGDVLFAADRAALAQALSRLRERGLPRAVVQRHVDGDLVKFYGVADPVAAAGETDLPPAWFKWFYPKEHPVAGHPFGTRALCDIACAAAAALDLEVWGGDAIVTPAGEILVIDINAWPSFALFRDEAAEHIAAHLAARVRRLARVAV